MSTSLDHRHDSTIRRPAQLWFPGGPMAAFSALALALTLALSIVLWCTGPDGLDLGFVLLLPGYVEFSVMLAALWLVSLAASLPIVRAAGLRALRRNVTTFRSASPARRLIMLGSMLLFLGAVDDWLAAPQAAIGLRMTAASSETPGLQHNIWNNHVPVLLADLADRQLDHQANVFVVDIDDEDARGHTAAYYAYPTLLVMAPDLRTWTLRERQTRVEADEKFAENHLDPAFVDPGPRPPLSASRAFAARRGLPLLRVSRRAVEHVQASSP